MKKLNLFSKVAITALFMAVVGNSCTNLDETLYTSLASSAFYQNDAEFSSAVGAVYTNMYGYAENNSIWHLQEVSSDEVLLPTRGTNWFDGGDYLRQHTHTYAATDAANNQAWSFCYNGIQTANRLIYQLNAANATKAAPYLAEIRAMRALYYYWLLDVFGNVPIVSSFPAAANPPTQPSSAVYAFILSELTAVIPQLAKPTSTPDNATYGRMNYWAAEALLTKLYINAKVYTGTDQSQLALTTANDIINNGPYKLQPNFSDNFITNNQGSIENIFVIPYDALKAQGFYFDAMTLHYAQQTTYNLTFQPWNGFCTAESFYNTFDSTTDKRLNASFIHGEQFAADGKTPILDSGYEHGNSNTLLNDPDGPAVILTPYVNELAPGCIAEAGARIGKYQFALGSTNNLSNDFVIFRLADVILEAAEANLNLGNKATATTQVNLIRARAGAPAFTTLDAPTLLAERGRELFAEGWRRSDMIRFGTFGSNYDFHYDYIIKNKAGTEKPCVSLVPIPQAQLNASSALVQNPCYQ